MTDSTNRKKWKPNFKYHVDYNDHFETPLVAYQDILPLLDATREATKVRQDQVVYDPYFCDGRTSIYLRQLGFEHVIHVKRDFYQDVANNTIPDHDTFITNPPYSDSHKEQCLEFCVRQFRDLKRPFFLLMPNYVAARSYYSSILGDVMEDVAYYVPSQLYEYDHPEGTGHEIPPFASLWFCGIGRDLIEKFKKSFKQPEFVASLEELKARNVIPTQKRPNPRQRKKRKAVLLGENTASSSSASPGLAVTKSLPSSAVTTTAGKSKKSKHRDENGQRKKKRF